MDEWDDPFSFGFGMESDDDAGDWQQRCVKRTRAVTPPIMREEAQQSPLKRTRTETTAPTREEAQQSPLKRARTEKPSTGTKADRPEDSSVADREGAQHENTEMLSERMCNYKRSTLHGNADCENEPSRKNLKIAEPAEDARRSGERTELVDGLVPRCAGQEAEAPNKEVMCGEGRSELVDGLDPLRTWPADQSLGVGGRERPSDSTREEAAPTLVPSVQSPSSSIKWVRSNSGSSSSRGTGWTVMPTERSSIYNLTGENQHEDAEKRDTESERAVGPVPYNTSNGEPGRGTQASRHPNNNITYGITQGDASFCAVLPPRSPRVAQGKSSHEGTRP